MDQETSPEWMQGFVPTPAPPRGRWEKGQSGNPKGRPVGRPDARTKITRALMEDAPAIAAVVAAAALEGDLQACSLVLSRCAPAVKAEAARVAFDFDATAPIPLQIEAVLTAIAAGELPADVGQTVISALGTLADARAVADLETRITTLEAKQP